MTEESPNENWILFEGSFAVPASLGGQVLGKVIPVARNYGAPLKISNEAMSFRVLTPEEIVAMKVRTKLLDGGRNE